MKLTAAQCDTIGRGYCPDCAHKGFRLGPRGGMSINIACMQCDAKFNVLNVGWDGCLWGERINRLN